jgi:16S rRNA (guanine527-N7)-methyltransferase
MPVPAWFAEVLEHELRPWLSLSSEQVAQLHTHYEHLERWNEKMNLTSLEPGLDLVVRHYCESLLLGANLPIRGSAQIADVGSGAGFPGVPVAVLRPECAVALVESVQRKAVFLREATRHLSNIEVIARRAEEVDRGFDWIVSRAVNPRELMQNIPRLAPNVGLLIGEASFLELKTLSTIAWREPVRVPWGDRKLIVVGVSRGT